MSNFGFRNSRVEVKNIEAFDFYSFLTFLGPRHTQYFSTQYCSKRQKDKKTF
jgi:hypothetical protein